MSHDQVVRAGVEHFLHRATLDMEALATELAISRATLYRVTTGRDALLGDVLAAITTEMFSRARAARTERGFAGVIQVTRHFAEQLQSSTIERFLDQDAEAASRILLAPSGAVHDSAVRAQTEVFRETGVIGALRDPDVAHAAHLYVRMTGALLYAEHFTGHKADLDDGIPALRLILFGPDD